MASSFKNPGIITDLRKNDVLLGRGTGPNEHEGNIRFRMVAADIMAACANDSFEGNYLNKTTAAKKLLAAIYERNGRFLRKLSREEVASFSKGGKLGGKPERKKDMFVVLPYRVALEKAKQSFRYQRRVLESYDNVPAKNRACLPEQPLRPFKLQESPRTSERQHEVVVQRASLLNEMALQNAAAVCPPLPPQMALQNAVARRPDTLPFPPPRVAAFGLSPVHATLMVPGMITTDSSALALIEYQQMLSHAALIRQASLYLDRPVGAPSLAPHDASANAALMQVLVQLKLNGLK